MVQSVVLRLDTTVTSEYVAKQSLQLAGWKVSSNEPILFRGGYIYATCNDNCRATTSSSGSSTLASFTVAQTDDDSQWTKVDLRMAEFIDVQQDIKTGVLVGQESDRWEKVQGAVSGCLSAAKGTVQWVAKGVRDNLSSLAYLDEAAAAYEHAAHSSHTTAINALTYAGYAVAGLDTAHSLWTTGNAVVDSWKCDDMVVRFGELLRGYITLYEIMTDEAASMRSEANELRFLQAQRYARQTLTGVVHELNECIDFALKSVAYLQRKKKTMYGDVIGVGVSLALGVSNPVSLVLTLGKALAEYETDYRLTELLKMSNALMELRLILNPNNLKPTLLVPFSIVCSESVRDAYRLLLEYSAAIALKPWYIRRRDHLLDLADRIKTQIFDAFKWIGSLVVKAAEKIAQFVEELPSMIRYSIKCGASAIKQLYQVGKQAMESAVNTAKKAVLTVTKAVIKTVSDAFQWVCDQVTNCWLYKSFTDGAAPDPELLRLLQREKDFAQFSMGERVGSWAVRQIGVPDAVPVRAALQALTLDYLESLGSLQSEAARVKAKIEQAAKVYRAEEAALKSDFVEIKQTLRESAVTAANSTEKNMRLAVASIPKYSKTSDKPSSAARFEASAIPTSRPTSTSGSGSIPKFNSSNIPRLTKNK